MVALLLLSSALLAQQPAAVQRAAQSITPADIQRRVNIIADDSMRGRDTPSPELDKTAAYIAGEFRRFGLKPGGDNGTFIQRYPLDRLQIVAESSVAFVHGGGPDVTLKYGTDFAYADNAFESGDFAGELVLISGPIAAAGTSDTASLAGKMLILSNTPRNRGERQRLMGWKPAGVIFTTAAPDSVWTQIVARSGRPQLRDPSRPNGAVTIGMRLSSLQPILARLGADFAAAQAATTFEIKSLGGVQFHTHARLKVVEHNTAPNVVGILEGSDPRLKAEYVVYSAHMDHVGVAGPRGTGGCRAVGADSICNGADDDGSGTVTVVELAEAFAGMNPRPKRSMIFLTVSGEEKGLWGSGWFADHMPVPATQVVADLNIDMVGRNWKDTIVVIGKEHSDLGSTLNRIAGEHPELNMKPIDDIWPDENFYFRSDHYNFARKGVPILFFFNGTHADYHRVSDSPDKIDAEKQSRVARLVFYLGLDVANSAARPKWNPDSFKRIVTAQ